MGYACRALFSHLQSKFRWEYPGYPDGYEDILGEFKVRIFTTFRWFSEWELDFPALRAALKNLRINIFEI